VASRALAFSDPAVIDFATRQFIPVAENCSYLQRQKDAKGEFFRLVAEQGHYAGRTQPSATRQGIYACTAEGCLLASINTRQAEPMLGMMREALQRWREEPADADRPEPLASYEPDPRAPHGYPEDGLVLKAYTRDLPRAVDARPDDWRRDAVNYDHAWFTREEADGLLPAEPSVRSRSPVSPAIVRRLARFHLLDNVRGETPMWREEEVRQAEMTVEVTALLPESVELCLEGAVRNVARGTWALRPFAEPLADTERGFDCRLRGFLRYDRSQARFVRFDLLAVGLRWGGSEHNIRGDDLEPAPMGVAFELAGSEPADRTPPQGSSAGYWGAPRPS
jgi:hypothetical protein